MTRFIDIPSEQKGSSSLPLRRALLCWLFFCALSLHGQHKITIKAQLDDQHHLLEITQEVLFHNRTSQTLHELVFYNWANSYSGKSDVLLSKRILEDYRDDLYTADKMAKGYCKIQSINTEHRQNVAWQPFHQQRDLLKIPLKIPLKKGEKRKVQMHYTVKVPSAIFTHYGFKKEGYVLRYWYLVPAVFEKGVWQADANMGLSDLYSENAAYKVRFTLPQQYCLSSNLVVRFVKHRDAQRVYELSDSSAKEAIITLKKNDHFEHLNFNGYYISTDVPCSLPDVLQAEKIKQALAFLEQYLGVYPRKKIYLPNFIYENNNNPILNIFPKKPMLHRNGLLWDLNFFMGLTSRFISELQIVPHETPWLISGLKMYLMLEYTQKYYPKEKLLGWLSYISGFKNYNLAKLELSNQFKIAYLFVNQQNLNQPLNTPLAKLSNFNREITNPFLAGMALNYLANYLGKPYFRQGLKQFFEAHVKGDNDSFKSLFNPHHEADWFFDRYLKTKKTIRYSLEKQGQKGDLFQLKIKRLGGISTPVPLYKLKGDTIVSKKWVTHVADEKQVELNLEDADRVYINYENFYPEMNQSVNWVSKKSKRWMRPFKFRFYQDIYDLDYNLIFYRPYLDYDEQNGLLVGVNFNNKTILKKNFHYSIKPILSTANNSLVGSVSADYQYVFRESRIFDRFFVGFGADQFYHKQGLQYRKFGGFVGAIFRKNFRSNTKSFIDFKFHQVNRQGDFEDTSQGLYNIYRLQYRLSQPNIVNDFRFSTIAEYNTNFSKLQLDLSYRHLFRNRMQLGFRFFGGTFINNKLDPNIELFNFNLSKPIDYNFDYKVYSRNNVNSFLHQQYIEAEGGFKSYLSNAHHSNTWMTTFTAFYKFSSIGHVYASIGAFKPSGQALQTPYEIGFGKRFILDLFEIYFPIYNQYGWEFKKAYNEKIRLVFFLDFERIYSYFRRGKL